MSNTELTTEPTLEETPAGEIGEGEQQPEFLDRQLDRRTVIQGIAALAASLPLSQFLKKLGIREGGNPDEAAPERVATATDHETAENLAHSSLGLKMLDGVGTACFVDAIVGLAREKNSLVSHLISMLDFGNGKEGQHDDTHHEHTFPMGNMYLAAALNLIRATGFGAETRKETIHELETTAVGVGLLMGLTSLAKGIVETEKEAGRLAEASQEDIAGQPEKVLSQSIFQLTYLATLTQLPLTAFGNAAIGNGEFGEVRASFDSIYLGFLPQETDTTGGGVARAYISDRLEQCGNQQVIKRVKAMLYGDSNLRTYGDYKKALEDLSRSHTNDLMSILMATSCDDAQAACGDMGPLVGLWQSFGNDFWKVIPSLFPYTLAMAVDRSTFAAKRAGIPVSEVLTRENIAYGGKFWLNTIKNLVLYFAEAAPKISARVAGRQYGGVEKQDGGVGRDFSLLESLLNDVMGIATTVYDAVMGSFDGKSLDEKKLQAALAQLQAAQKEYEAQLGRELIDKVEADGGTDPQVPVNKQGLQDIRDEVLGRRSGHEALGDLQGLLDKMSQNVDEGAVAEFVSGIGKIREELGPELLKALADLQQREGGRKTPSIQAVATVLKKNPRVGELLDFGYWHERIGSELTDTMFVVTLQGFHLSFIINTLDRFIYSAGWFKKLPLVSQEVISVFINNIISMFADNWADCVAHSKWITKLYFNALDGWVAESLYPKYPEIKKQIEGGFLEDDTTKNNIPARFSKRKQQFAALITDLKAKHPEDATALDKVLQEYFELAQAYYWKAMNIAMLPAVTGGGKAKTGNAPHFTFAAGVKDYTLMETLRDFTRHPVYHLWEFTFSTSYAIGFGPALSKILFGSDAAQDIQKIMQERFRQQFPEFHRKLQELQQKEGRATI